MIRFIRFPLTLQSSFATRSPYESSQNQALLHLTRYRGWGRGRGGNRSKHSLLLSSAVPRIHAFKIFLFG